MDPVALFFYRRFMIIKSDAFFIILKLNFMWCEQSKLLFKKHKIEFYILWFNTSNSSQFRVGFFYFRHYYYYCCRLRVPKWRTVFAIPNPPEKIRNQNLDKTQLNLCKSMKSFIKSKSPADSEWRLKLPRFFSFNKPVNKRVNLRKTTLILIHLRSEKNV